MEINRLIDISNDEYHSSAGISKSHLDVVAGKSPKHYWDKYINPEREPREETRAMRVGTACHTAILEPHDLGRCIVRGLGIDRRSNANKEAWAAFERQHADKIILSDDDYDHVLRVRDAVHSHPVAAGLLQNGVAERSLFSQDTDGTLIKCRFDFLHDTGMVVDLKSTEDASPAGFAKSVANYRYDVQAAWYYYVHETAFGSVPSDWVFIAIEKDRPYAVGVYFLKGADIQRAHDTAMRDYSMIKACRDTGNWPDYGIEPKVIELPGWVRR